MIYWFFILKRRDNSKYILHEYKFLWEKLYFICLVESRRVNVAAASMKFQKKKYAKVEWVKELRCRMKKKLCCWRKIKSVDVEFNTLWCVLVAEAVFVLFIFFLDLTGWLVLPVQWRRWKLCCGYVDAKMKKKKL